MTHKIRIAVIGPGDAASVLARKLADAGADVMGFDLSPLAESSNPVAESLEQAVSSADVVLSLNSSSAALRTAERVSALMETGAIFADLNTATPALKRKLAEKFAPDAFVDVALMSPVSQTDGESVIAVAGPGAQTFIDRHCCWNNFAFPRQTTPFLEIYFRCSPIQFSETVSLVWS